MSTIGWSELCILDKVISLADARGDHTHLRWSQIKASPAFLIGMPLLAKERYYYEARTRFTKLRKFVSRDGVWLIEWIYRDDWREEKSYYDITDLMGLEYLYRDIALIKLFFA